MKKLVALLAALCLLLAAFAALAEEAAIIENKPSYKGDHAAIADTGLQFLLPKDWQAAQPPEGVDGDVYVNADATVALTVTAAKGRLDNLREQYAALVEAGRLDSCGMARVNGRDWLLCATADGLQNYAQTALDDDHVLSFVFVVSAPGAKPEYEMEIIGSLSED